MSIWALILLPLLGCDDPDGKLRGKLTGTMDVDGETIEFSSRDSDPNGERIAFANPNTEWELAFDVAEATIFDQTVPGWVEWASNEEYHAQETNPLGIYLWADYGHDADMKYVLAIEGDVLDWSESHLWLEFDAEFEGGATFTDGYLEIDGLLLPPEDDGGGGGGGGDVGGCGSATYGGPYYTPWLHNQ